MGSRGRLLFDLNELPAEDYEDNNRIICSQPQTATPSAISMASDIFATPISPQDLGNSLAFSHTSSVSGFQPFVQLKTSQLQNNSVEDDASKAATASSTTCENSKAFQMVPGSADVQTTEREEGEWVGTEIFANQHANSSLDNIDTGSLEQGTSETGHASEGTSKTTEKDKATTRSNQDSNANLKKNTGVNSEDSAKVDVLTDCREEQGLMCSQIVKRKIVKGVEASHAVKCANTSVKRKIDQQKEAMLGKKRNRQTMFLNLEDVKQAGSVKISTPRRQNFPQPIITRTVKEARTAPPPFEHGGDIQHCSSNKDQKTTDVSSTGSTPAESREYKLGRGAQLSPGLLGKPRILNGNVGASADLPVPSSPSQASWRQPIDSSQHKATHSSIRQSSLISQTSVDSMTKNKTGTFQKGNDS